MTIFLLILMVIVFVKLVMIAALTPNISTLSLFELQRRKTMGDRAVELDAIREELFQEIIALQRALVAVLLVIFVLLSVAALGVFIGTLIGILAALGYGSVSRLKQVRSLSQKLYDTHEHAILMFLWRHESITRWFGAVIPSERDSHLNSREELLELVTNSHSILSTDEKNLIISSLKFEDKTVESIMTPKSVVDTIPQHEILGPLVLDDLHKTGHSRFPVIAGDIDHVVGILHLRDVLTVDSHSKQTPRVEAAMQKKVFYIREDHTLPQALAAFLRTKHHLFIVINEFRETVGVVTLEDTLEALLGRKIVDEFDAHDDMRAVAARQAAKRSNQAAGSTEV